MTANADDASKEFRLPVGGFELTGRQYGQPGGRPVLALHGWMDHADSFAPMAPLLDHCHLIALDLPGHGNTAMGEQGHWFHYIDNVALVFQLLNALGWDRCHLIGHSMGGGLSALAAAAFPDRVDSLVSIDMLGPIASPPEQAVSQLRKGIIDRAQGLKQRFFATEEETLAARENPHFPIALCRILGPRGIEKTERGFSWRGDRRLKWGSLQRFTEDQVRAVLESIKCPSLVLLAEQERYPQMTKLLATRQGLVENETVITGPGGHHLHMENPQICADHINEFYRGLES